MILLDIEIYFYALIVLYVTNRVVQLNYGHNFCQSCLLFIQTISHAICSHIGKDKCHKECYFRYYWVNMLEVRDNDDYEWMDVSIIVKHNAMPDLFIRHIPEMPFITFICNFGGLLGMWLGVSFLTILSAALPLIRRWVRHIPVNYFQNCTFNFNLNVENVKRILPRKINY